jgi:hypothetical protein
MRRLMDTTELTAGAFHTMGGLGATVEVHTLVSRASILLPTLPRLRGSVEKGMDGRVQSLDQVPGRQ